MTKFARVLVAGGAVVLVVVVGIAVGWFGSGAGKNQPPAVDPNASTTDLPPSNPTKFARNPPPDLLHIPSIETPSSTGTTTNLLTDWEDRLDGILSAESKEDQKAKQLLEMFPNLPEEGQVEVAQHLSNLLTDQDYAPLGHLLTNAALPEAVLDVFMADVLNRPNATKLPLILEVARTPEHPKATEAKDLLELFLEENYDQDWTKWQTKLDQWLKDNPD